MKTIRIITASLLATLALTACTNENDMPDAGTLPEGAVHITGNIGGTTTRATINDDGTGTFQTGDTWGMYTTIGSTPSMNREYKYGETVLYWDDLSTTTDVTFSAHYPRQTGEISNPTAYWFTPQGTVFEDDDLLFATATQSKGNKVELTFKHLMHRLVINLQTGAGMEGADLSGVSIETIDQSGGITMRATIPVNLLTGKLGEPMYDADYYSIGPNYDMIVVPQTLTAGADWLTITLDGDTWYYPVPANLNPSDPAHPTRLESGKKLTLTLTLKKTAAGDTEVELTSSGISAWGDQGTINDEVTTGGTTATITADQVKAALTGTGIDPIVIDGDLTLSLDADIRLSADHTITINPGVTLTFNNGYSIYSENNNVCTLTINGGGTFLFDESNQDFQVINNAILNLENVTVEMKGGSIMNCAIEVGAGGTIVVDNPLCDPIQSSSKNLTVKGNIHIKNFQDIGIYCEGTLLIDGGTISIEGSGTPTGGNTPAAVRLDGGTANLEITNGGKLTSTVADGVVFLSQSTKVKGASGLFKTSTYPLETNDEVTVSSNTGATNALIVGFYKWNAGESKFVWASAQ